MKNKNINFKKISFDAICSDMAEKLLNDVRSIYQENYPNLTIEELNGYMLEDMLEAYLNEENDIEDIMED